MLAIVLPDSTWTLVDAHQRRCQFLGETLPRLGLDTRVQICCQRAEDLGHEPRWRSAADLVVARGFARPAVTAECAAPLLHPGGCLVVAEPPGGSPGRWPAAGLDLLGLEATMERREPVSLQRLDLVRTCPDRYPRRVGVPAKRPLW